MYIRTALIGFLTILFSYSATFAAEKGQWNGFYSGIQAGWASIDNNYSHPGDRRHGTFDIESDGPLIGLVAGFNWKKGNFLLGVEGDFSFANINGESETKPDHIVETNWIATLRGRAGVFVSNNVMVYATAGLVTADSDFTHIGRHKWDETLYGWTAGAGFEIATKDGIRLGFDAIYVGFEEETDTHDHTGKGDMHTLANDASGVIGRARIIVPLQ